MTDRDNITLPREVVQEAVEALVEARALLYDGRKQDKAATALRTALAAEQPKHPGYVIGSHWLETAYSRVCAGEAEADVLRDCGWERVDDIEALRRDAERYRYLRDKAYVWDSDMPKAMRPVALWLHADGNANTDAAIDAAMGDKT